MLTVEREVDRYLTLIRNKIHERGYTQLQVQEALGWGRSYISQLLTKQKALRIEQVLFILGVLGIDPAEFFGELYGTPPYYRAQQTPLDVDMDRELEELRGLVRGLGKLLLDRNLISAEELDAALQDGDRTGES